MYIFYFVMTICDIWPKKKEGKIRMEKWEKYKKNLEKTFKKGNAFYVTLFYQALNWIGKELDF